jgi:lipopolysaccharide transport system ATP-binding protein
MNAKIRSDKTVVLVSHNAAVVRSLCDRLVWINQGKVRAEGNTQRVLAMYDKYMKRQLKEL